MRGEIWKKVFKNYGVIIFFVILVIILSLLSNKFLNIANVLNIIRQSSIIGLVAIGSTLTIISGNFDLSVGSVAGLTGVIAISLTNRFGVVSGVIIALLVGIVVGFINGFLVTKARINSFIVTLGMMTIVRGCALLWTNGYIVAGKIESYKLIGRGMIGPIPIPIIILVVFVAIFWFFMQKTRTGRYIYAVGGNKETAYLSGISVSRYQTMCYVIGGFLAAIAGIVLTSRMNAATPNDGTGYEFDAITGTIIGGTSLAGGEGNVLKSILGVILLNVINNGFNILNVNPYIQYVFRGFIILASVAIYSVRFRKE
ncbi:MAG: ABC transporter permease [Actinobacteria bacterium]|nr:ABC transporter permease [Cyanobacteriota bacterium]MCL5772152.1 ABC transporter permease [Actinomycetota bacterium]